MLRLTAVYLSTLFAVSFQELKQASWSSSHDLFCNLWNIKLSLSQGYTPHFCRYILCASTKKSIFFCLKLLLVRSPAWSLGSKFLPFVSPEYHLNTWPWTYSHIPRQIFNKSNINLLQVSSVITNNRLWNTFCFQASRLYLWANLKCLVFCCPFS